MDLVEGSLCRIAMAAGRDGDQRALVGNIEAREGAAAN
jgi:hypothetical protein